MISPAGVVFVVLSVVTLGGGLVAVVATNLFRSALGLMASLMGVAGLFLLQQAEFLAVVQVMIYVGGVSVLIVFAIMLTERGQKALEVNVNKRVAPWAALVGATLTAMVVGLVHKSLLADSPAAEVAARDLGIVFLNRYLVPFEAVSLLLLVALVGAIFIAREEGKS